jgi:steroid delta-isomerase-like uncharacterized protein
MSNYFRTFIILLAGVLGPICVYAQCEDCAKVHGRITTVWGQAIPDAKVSFSELERISGWSPTSITKATVKTDKEGNYSVENLPPGQYHVYVGTDSWAEVWRFYLHGKADKVLDLGTSMGFLDWVTQITIDGRVLQPNGQPITDAAVTLTNAFDPSHFEQTRSDAKGKFHFNEIQVGDYILQATIKGFLPKAANIRLGNGEHKIESLTLTLATESNSPFENKKSGAIVPAPLIAERSSGDKRVIDQLFAGWNSRDADKFVVLFADDAVYEDIAAGRINRGRTEIREWAAQAFADIENFKIDLISSTVHNGHGVVEWIWSGTDKGLLKTGKNFSVRGVSVIEVRKGKISKYKEFYDFATVMRQLGVLPAGQE